MSCNTVNMVMTSSITSIAIVAIITIILPAVTLRPSFRFRASINANTHRDVFVASAKAPSLGE